MTEEQITYVVDQLQAGHGRAAIAATLTSGGYTEPQIAELFSQADRRIGKATGAMPAAADSTTPVNSESVTTEHAASTVSLSTPHRSHKGLWVGVTFVLVVLLLAGIAAAAMTGLIKLPNALTNIFASAPYEPENVLVEIRDGLGEVDSSGYKIAFSIRSTEKDGDTYLFPPELASDEYEDNFSGFFAMLPEDFSAEATISGDVDTDGGETPDTHSRFTGSYSGDDFTFNADAELVISKADGAYVRINRMPSLFFLDFSPIKGDWVHIIERPLNELYDEFAADQLGEDSDESAQAQLIFEQANKHNVFRVDGEPVKEDIDGQTAYRYTLVLNQSPLRNFIEDTSQVLEAEYGTDNVWSELELDEDIERITSQAYVDFINTHVAFNVWARSDGVPVRFGVLGRIAVDTDVRSSLDQAREKAVDASKKATLNTLRADAELFYDENKNSYEGYCDSSALSWLSSDWVYDCNDSVTEYAVEVLLEDGSWCIDSTGFANNGSILLVGDTFCDVSTVATADLDEVAPVAERQVNITLTIDLTNVNEPVTVEIPTDAMNLEEASEKVPMLQFLVGGLLEAQDSGLDAAKKQSVSTLRAHAEIYYDDNNYSYKGVCQSNEFLQLDDEHGIACVDSTQAYAAEIELHDEYYCIDSTGFADTSFFSLIDGTECLDLLSDEPISRTYDDEIKIVEPPAPSSGSFGSGGGGGGGPYAQASYGSPYAQPSWQQRGFMSADRMGVAPGDHVRGNPNAPIVIIEYSDFDCPFCKNYHGTMKDVMNLYGETGDVAWVYRHFPLVQLHPNAAKIAVASECVADSAGNDGFWIFADLVFEGRDRNQPTDMNRLEEYAVAAGADLQQYQTCYSSPLKTVDVDHDYDEAIAIGGRGTPYSVVIVDGEVGEINGAQPLQVLVDTIDELRAQLGN